MKPKYIPTLDIESSYYKMDHKYRGSALIFDHTIFDRQISRKGTSTDTERVKKTFSSMGFNIFTYKDLSKNDIITKLKQVAKEYDEKQDCLVVIIMTHGNTTELWAKDKPYEINKVIEIFSAESCVTLIGKPKLFFIQTWSGMDTQDITLNGSEDDIDSTIRVYNIPTTADILVMYSITEGKLLFFCNFLLLYYIIYRNFNLKNIFRRIFHATTDR